MQEPSSARIRLNRYFMSLLAFWASALRDFEIPLNLWLVSFDIISMLWSAIIILTNIIKYKQFRQSRNQPRSEYHDLLLLNYTPNIDAFCLLYYAALSVIFGFALLWRIYLNVYRTLEPYRRLHPTRTSHCKPLFDPKLELLKFILSGPDEAGHKSSQEEGKGRTDTFFFCDETYDFEKLALVPIQLPKHNNLLFRMHMIPSSKEKLVQGLHEMHEEPRGESFLMDNGMQQVYHVPIKSKDFLYDKSRQRWLALVNRIYCFALYILVASSPLWFYTIVGLKSVLKQYGSNEDTWQRKILNIYGPLEQFYACSQGSVLILGSSILITVFYVDLAHKAKIITADLKSICELYCKENIVSLPLSEVIRQKMRIWAYFDSIATQNVFVSEYSKLSIALVIVCLSFGQSFMRLEEWNLKAGIAAGLGGYVASFVWLNVISWMIVRQSQPMQKYLLSIIARESNHFQKREWQRALLGHFAPHQPRTYTLGSRFVLGLRLCFRTIISIMLLSYIGNRVFHKRQGRTELRWPSFES